MLSNGREIAADARENLSALEGSKGSRDFLLNFHHANILLGLIIGEWDIEVVEESQDARFMFFETIQEIKSFGLFRAAAFSGRSEGAGLGVVAFLQNGSVPLEPGS